MKVYFASPLFSKAEIEFNQNLTDQIEKLGFDVFLPQRDGVEKSKHPFNSMTKEYRRKAMFELDRDHIFHCDIFLFILDGRVPDEGASVELGLAYGHKYYLNQNRILIGLHTDSRAAFLNTKLNPMISESLDQVFEKESELISFLINLANMESK